MLVLISWLRVVLFLFEQFHESGLIFLGECLPEGHVVEVGILTFHFEFAPLDATHFFQERVIDLAGKDICYDLLD